MLSNSPGFESNHCIAVEVAQLKRISALISEQANPRVCSCSSYNVAWSSPLLLLKTRKQVTRNNQT
jgi:hypothetical protein